MTAEDFIQKTHDALCDLSAELRAEAARADGEQAEILRAAANTASIQATRWLMFGEMNLGREPHAQSEAKS